LIEEYIAPSIEKVPPSETFIRKSFRKGSLLCGGRVTIPGLAIKVKALTDDIGTALAAALD
jgi:hypothetical protein